MREGSFIPGGQRRIPRMELARGIGWDGLMILESHTSPVASI